MSIVSTDVSIQKQKGGVKRMLALVKWFLAAVDTPVVNMFHIISSLRGNHTTVFLAKRTRPGLKWRATASTTGLSKFRITHPLLHFTCAKKMQTSTFMGRSKLVQVPFSHLAVKFHGNWVSIRAEAPGFVRFNESGETYKFSKFAPDMNMTNVVLGKRRMTWEGPITIECKKTGVTCEMKFSEEVFVFLIVPGCILEDPQAQGYHHSQGRRGGHLQWCSYGEDHL